MEQFLGKMQDLLDCEQEVKMDTDLSGIDEWDSLSVVAFIAMAKASYGKAITGAVVRKAETIADLYDIVK